MSLIVPMELDRQRLIDDLAAVVARHLRGSVAHLSSSLEPSNLDPKQFYLTVKFLVARRPWTAIDRMREAIDVGRK
jgi:hypothetical protein